MRTSFKSTLLLLVLSFVLTSCGDVFMKKSEDNGNEMQQFATCAPDPQALSGIFTQNVKSDLLCLEKNLNLFIEVVRTDRPGNLSLKELKIYIKKNIEDVDSSVLEALSGIFDLNSLIFGDDKEYINKGNVRKLTQLLIDINKAIVDNKVYHYYTTSETAVPYAEHNRRKAKVYTALTYVAERLQQEFKKNGNVINLISFLEKFKSLDNNIILQNCTDLLFFKRMFLGGDEEVLTSYELKRLAGMLPDFGKVVFDIAHIGDVEHSEHQDEEVLLTIREDAATIVRNLYYKGQDYVNVMTLQDIWNTVAMFSPEHLKYKKYTNSILKLKAALLENSTPSFNSNELMILFNEIALNNLDKAAFFYRMYAYNSDVLSGGDQITTDLPALISIEKAEESFKDDFNRIIKSYRFFKGKEFSASFNNFIKRNPLGMVEVAVLEDMVKRLFAVYGDPKPTALGGYRVTQTQLENMMMEYKDFLEGEGITDPGRTRNTAETITLMTSLFQSQSDGDTDIEVNEMVEFAVELMSSTQVSKIADKYFRTRCPEVDDKGRYSPECFRDNFVGMLEEEKNGKKVGEHLGKLRKYVNNPSTNVSEYLQISEVFTRSCTLFDDGTPVPMDEDELFLLLSGMMAVEQTIIRYDTNNDNILQGLEVEKAFPVYESAIRALLPDLVKGVAKKVFHYMIKNEKIPGTAAVMAMVANPFPPNWKKVNATRKTLAIILKTLSEESPANEANPFPCETLR